MMRTIWYPALLLILLMNQSCRLAETQNKLPQQTADLFVRYLQPEKEYKIEAQLLEGDSLPVARAIPFPQGIRFAGKDLSETQVTETLLRYDATFGAEFSPAAQFSFKDKNGTQHQVALDMTTLEGLALSFPDKLEGQVSLDIAQGGQLRANESLVLVLTDREGQASTVTIEGPSTSGSYGFPLVAFGNPAKGKAEVYLVKKQNRQDTKGKLHIHLTEELYSGVLEVSIP